MHCKEIKCPKCGGTMRRQARPGPVQPGGGSSPGAVASGIQDVYEELLQAKDEHIADLKAGRVLSRKNRNIVKEAITALNAVLEADAAGTQEDEDSAGTVTERDTEIEIVKDGEPEIKINEEDIAKLIKTTLDTVAMEKIEKALKENLDPKKIKESMREIARLEIQRIKGKVE